MEPWAFAHPNRFPTEYTGTRLKHVLAPFWSDNDIRREGTVRYVTIERGNSADGDQIMIEATMFVNERFTTWMLVAQWEGVHPYPHGSDNHEGISEEYLSRVSIQLFEALESFLSRTK